jgi:hypothetical protein
VTIDNLHSGFMPFFFGIASHLDTNQSSKPTRLITEVRHGVMAHGCIILSNTLGIFLWQKKPVASRFLSYLHKLFLIHQLE